MLTLIIEFHRDLERDFSTTISLIETGIDGLNIVKLHTNGTDKYSLICEGEWYRDIKGLNDSQKQDHLKNFLSSSENNLDRNELILMCRDIIGTEEIMQEEMVLDK